MYKLSGIFIIVLFLLSSLWAKDDLEIDIPYQKHVLDNGLTVILHEDHKAPIVAVNVWYHVGSKNEKKGKTGFAHLFEHLMFNGSENQDDDYFQVMERIGATDLNGTTNSDRTNYFENVPKSALDIALFMESDRMGHLLGAITQEKLDEQRGVVQNEKRQGDNQPYGLVDQLITENIYPSEHPYSWTTIGSMDDLDAASLDDVHEWFKTYYGAANAVIAIAGDINPDEALAKVKNYFGDIPAGPPIARHDTWIAKRTGSHRQLAQDRVPQSRIYKVWNIPEWGNEELTYLDLTSDVLSVGKNSRFYKRLVYEDQIATSVAAYYSPGEIGSQFTITADAKPGTDLSEVEKALDEELARFMKDGPTEEELSRIKTQYVARFVRGIERIGGFGGKSDILAQNEVYGGNPDYYKKVLGWVKNATTKKLKNAANKWLSDGVYILEVHPYPEFTTSKTDIDRSKLPVAGTPPDATFPNLQRATLSNGMKIILAERASIPVVNFNLMLDAGYAADQFAKPGTANLAMNMLDEGTKNMASLEINEKLALLGANLGSGSNLDISSVSLSALKNNLDASLDIYADVILNPSFPKKDFERLQKETLVRIQREKSTPIQMALRVFPELLYGSDHAYGNPFTGSGNEESVLSLTPDDLIKFHKTWFKPNNATMVVVGDIKMSEVKDKLEKLFDDWEKGDVPQKNISKVDYKDKNTVFMIDRPGSQQSIIFAGHVALPKNNPDEEAIQIMNNILGGDFTSRINMNLREDKHWSYGAQTILLSARGQRPFITYAPVQTDKTLESMQEIQKELTEIISNRPPTEKEFDKTQKNEILQLSGRWETNRAVAGSIANIVRYGYADDYYNKYPEVIRNLKLDDIQSAAKKVVLPDNLVWVVVGDLEKIKAGIEKAGIGEIKVISVDGKPLSAK